jgi:hypothetical protein
MSKVKITPQQLSTLKDIVNEKKRIFELNQNYNLDYVKFMFHPETPNFVVLKMRSYGISSGMPFDDIDYTFIDSNGQIIEYKNQFFSIPAWFQYTSEMKEINIINGEAILAN